MGRYCSYLLPKQTGGSTQIIIFKTLRMIGRPALYFGCTWAFIAEPSVTLYEFICSVLCTGASNFQGLLNKNSPSHRRPALFFQTWSERESTSPSLPVGLFPRFCHRLGLSLSLPIPSPLSFSQSPPSIIPPSLPSFWHNFPSLPLLYLLLQFQ